MSTTAAFAMMQNEFEKVNADQGNGSLGEWPLEGNHQCYVLSMTIDENATFRQSSDGQEFPSVSVQFEYQLVDDPDRAQPLVWKGAPMNLIKDISNLTHDGSLTRNRIELERLKGHMKTLLGSQPADFAAGINEIQTKLDSDNAIVAMVRCIYQVRGERTYKSEKLQHLISN